MQKAKQHPEDLSRLLIEIGPAQRTYRVGIFPTRCCPECGLTIQPNDVCVIPDSGGDPNFNSLPTFHSRCVKVDWS